MTDKQAQLDALAVLEAVRNNDVDAVRTILDDSEHESLVWVLAALTLGLGSTVFRGAADPQRQYLTSLRRHIDLRTGEFRQ